MDFGVLTNVRRWLTFLLHDPLLQLATTMTVNTLVPQDKSAELEASSKTLGLKVANVGPLRQIERKLGDTEASYYLPSRENGVNDMYVTSSAH